MRKCAFAPTMAVRGPGDQVAAFAPGGGAAAVVAAFGGSSRPTQQRRNSGARLTTAPRLDRYRGLRQSERGQTSKEIAVTIGVVVVLVLALTGGYTLLRNGGGTGPSTAQSSATATPVSDAQFAALADTAASQSVLRLSDLPSGWTSEPHSTSPDSKSKLPERCQLLSDDQLPNAVVNKDSDDFKAGALIVSSGVAVYRTAELASNTAQLYIAVALDCKDAMAAAMRTDLADTMSGANTSFSESQSSVPSARVFRATATGQIRGKPTIIRVDLGFVVGGRIISGVTTATVNDDPAAPKIDDLLALLLKRATDADATLPR